MVLSSMSIVVPKSFVTNAWRATTRMPISSGELPHAFWLLAR